MFPALLRADTAVGGAETKADNCEQDRTADIHGAKTIKVGALTNPSRASCRNWCLS